jgi:membrane protease YdiL (CAAX protease family)
MNEEETQDHPPEEREAQGQKQHLTIAHAIGMILLLAVLQLLASSLLAKSGLSILEDSSWVNIAVTHAVSGFLTAEAGAILAGLSLLAMLSDSHFKVQALPSLILGFFGVSILSSELTNFLQWIEPIDQAYIEAFQELFSQNQWGVFLAIGIIAPVTEELIFRGVILEGLRERYRISTAIFTTTILFGVVHIFPWVIVNAFLLGLVLAWLKLETRSLMLCILAHSFYNSLPFLLTGIFSIDIPGYTSLPGEKVQFQPWWFDLLGVVLAFFGFQGLRSVYSSMETVITDPDAENAPWKDGSPLG